MVNCIIVDDEPLAQQILEEHIMKTEGLHLVKKCNNALEAFEILNRQFTDLMFLDIKMPSLSGIDFIKSLKNPPAVIFTTAFSEYAATSYELEAVDYLLKPITYERFTKSLAKYFKIQPKPEPELTHTYFKVNGKLVKLQHGDIISAQSIKDYIIINTLHGNYITHMTMKYLTNLLPATLFRRVHRSFIIGILHIKSIGRNEIELGDRRIQIGENYKVNVDELKKNDLK
jgi:two-component system LytT family response regulator